MADRGLPHRIALALAALLVSIAPLEAQEAKPDSVPSEPLGVVDIRVSEPIPTDPLTYGLAPGDTVPVLAPRFREGRAATELAEIPGEDVLPKNPRDAAIRAFLVPGWGQFYTDHPWRGAAFAAAEVGLFAAGYAKQREALDKKDEIEATRRDFFADPPEGAPEDSLALEEEFRRSLEFRQLEAELDNIEEQREDFYAWGLLTTIFAALDAYAAAQLDPIEVGSKPAEGRIWAAIRFPVGPPGERAREGPR